MLELVLRHVTVLHDCWALVTLELGGVEVLRDHLVRRGRLVRLFAGWALFVLGCRCLYALFTERHRTFVAAFGLP